MTRKCLKNEFFCSRKKGKKIITQNKFVLFKNKRMNLKNKDSNYNHHSKICGETEKRKKKKKRPTTNFKQRFKQKTKNNNK